jgi:methylmalonyl-CoA mutase cobalamin-binding subunit
LKVFLATLGPAGRYMARLDFAASFFETGGFEVIRTEGFETPKAAAEAAISAKARVVLICGLDESYSEGAGMVAEKVREGRPGTIIALAGPPGDHPVDLFIHLGSNVLETLTEVAVRLGVAP